ncbi:MAG: hypothetical protein ACI9TV_001086 [Sulfurimonas sp.]|jgi:hypothetical protein|uniref:hypothetical protein n=1 Tax=Sulfurimonas sp. TaxID=2022749 RepID=UPI0039E6DCD6
MFANILGKSKEEANEDKEHQIIVDKVAKMNLVDMRVYVNNKLNDFEICTDGLSEVMRKINSKDINGKRFIETDAMDSKKKKAFEIVIMVSNSTKLSIFVAELIQEFIEFYKDIIMKYDTENKDIYGRKLKIALAKSIGTISTMADMNRKMKVIGS